MKWFENPDADPLLEESIRQSETMKEMARWASESYVESGFIAEAQRAQKMRAIGVEDRL